MRVFEVHLNGNFDFPAYTLEMENARQARAYAIREAKMNRNSTVDIFEIGGKEYVSGTIKIN